MFKRCGSCGVHQPTDQFYADSYSPDRLQRQCKECRRAYQREWMAERRRTWFSGKACCDCGATVELELDHRDPADKIDHRVWSWSAERRGVELAKCDVRCADCHGRRHGAEQQRHGGIGRYEDGCRCDECMDAYRRKIERRQARMRQLVAM